MRVPLYLRVRYFKKICLKVCQLSSSGYMGWFPFLVCKNYIFKRYVKTVEATPLKFCTVLKLLTLHLEQTIAQLKYTNCSSSHAQTFVLLNGEMATVSTFFKKFNFLVWTLWTVIYLKQTGLSRIYTYLQNKRMRRCGVPPPPTNNFRKT